MRAALRAAAFLVASVACVAPPCPAATNRVPADFSTIHAALAASALGDTVLVSPGTYSDYILYGENEAYIGQLPDGVVLRSEAGPTQTIIDLAPLEGVTYWSAGFGMFGNGSGQTVIDGFRIVGFPEHSAGVTMGFSALVEVRNCSFEIPEGSVSTEAWGIAGLNSDLRAINCTFLRCRREAGGSAIQVGPGHMTVEGCTFIECGTSVALAGGSEGSLLVRDCLFQRCMTVTGGACIATGSPDVLIDNCVFEEIEALDGLGAVLSLSGSPGEMKVVSNNVFRDVTIAEGSAACVHTVGGVTTFTGNTFVNLHQPPYGSDSPGVAIYGSQTVAFLENNIFAHTSGIKAVGFKLAPPPTLDCNVFWDNADGIGVELSPTDRIADPQFCDPDNGDYTLQATSPCLPALSLGCGLIGALGQGCGTVGVTQETWGKIKSSFRTDGNGKEIRP